MRRGAAANVGNEIAGDALVRPEDEDAFGMRRGELAAARRRAGLVQHRRPLRRRLGQVNCVYLVMAALMPLFRRVVRRCRELSVLAGN
jgi:hypothetical protein